MKSCNIYYWDNGVGVKVDSQLIKDCLSKYFKCKIFDTSIWSEDYYNNFNVCIDKKSDIGVFVQNINIEYLNYNKINIFICNEEWLGDYEIENLNLFDIVIVKSEYAKKQIQHLHNNIICLYFWSQDFYDQNYNTIERNINLHFAGRSIQKNTECILNNEDIHIFDNNARFIDIRKKNYYTRYLSNNKLEHVFNLSKNHICPSLYEAHGHYMFEGLLCNKNIIASRLPVWEEQIDPDIITFVDTYQRNDETYEFLSEDSLQRHPFRKGYFVDIEHLEYCIKNTSNKKPRKFVKDLFKKNKNKFLEFFNSI